jgi:hypothetical protein
MGNGSIPFFSVNIYLRRLLGNDSEREKRENLGLVIKSSPNAARD